MSKTPRPDLFPDRPISPEELRVFTRRAMGMVTWAITTTEQREQTIIEQRDVDYLVDATSEDEAMARYESSDFTDVTKGDWEEVDSWNETEAHVIRLHVEEIKEK